MVDMLQVLETGSRELVIHSTLQGHRVQAMLQEHCRIFRFEVDSWDAQSGAVTYRLVPDNGVALVKEA